MVGANWVAYLSGGHAAASTASAADHFWHIEIMRAFVKPRELLVSNKELARRFTELEARLDKKLTEHDQAPPDNEMPAGQLLQRHATSSIGWRHSRAAPGRRCTDHYSEASSASLHQDSIDFACPASRSCSVSRPTALRSSSTSSFHVSSFGFC